MEDGDGFVTARAFEPAADTKTDAGVNATLRRVTILDPDTGYISSAGSINQSSSLYDTYEETAAQEDWNRIVNGCVGKPNRDVSLEWTRGLLPDGSKVIIFVTFT
jgi:hypothetical protein